MSEEGNVEITSPEAPNNAEIDKLKASVQALEKKNYDLIGKLQKNELIGEVPDDYEALKDFKRKAEQSKLESEGKYTEARQALEQQFREASEEKDKRIADLEAQVRELELITPANTALADVVHDPSIVFKAQLLNPTKLNGKLMGPLLLSTVMNANQSANGPKLCPVTCRKHQSHKAAERRQAAVSVVTSQQAPKTHSPRKHTT